MRIIITEKKIKYGLFIVPAGLLFGALAEGAPYEYFQVLRVVVSVAALILAAEALDSEDKYFPFLFGCIVLLFNPILPFHFRRGLWQALDVLSGGVFLLYGLFKIKHSSKTKPAKLSPEMRKIYGNFSSLYQIINGFAEGAINTIWQKDEEHEFLSLIETFKPEYDEKQLKIVKIHFRAFQEACLFLIIPAACCNSPVHEIITESIETRLTELMPSRNIAHIRANYALFRRNFFKHAPFKEKEDILFAVTSSFWNSLFEKYPGVFSPQDSLSFSLNCFLRDFFVCRIEAFSVFYENNLSRHPYVKNDVDTTFIPPEETKK